MACRTCGAEPARPYLTGEQCPLHTPAAAAGRPDIQADPDRALEALQRQRGKLVGFSRADSALIDARAVAAGKRRSGPATYREAQRAVARG